MKVLSLHIGLNHIDPEAYGSDGELANCLNDCKAMSDIAKANGFQITALHDSEATCPRVTLEISKAAKELQSGDYYIVTYAGHGSQVPDEDNEETDGMNETWVLYDRMMLDNELYHLWSTFKPGVKIFVVSDSCHSGTMMRPFLMQVQPQLQNLAPLGRALSRNLPKLKRELAPISKSEIVQNITTLAKQEGKYDDGKSRDPLQKKVRLLPVGNSLKNYVENRELYRTVSLLAGDKRDADIHATLLYISGCLDNQTSADGPAGTNGLFTGNLLRVWDKGKFTGTYNDFYSRIIGLMPSDQSPNYMKLGVSTTEYEKEKPFTVKKTTTTATSTPTPATSSQLTNPSLDVPAKLQKTDTAPTFKVNKGGNPLYYVELATDNKLFNKKDYGSGRNESNFYASYQDSDVIAAGSFLISNTSYLVPDKAWQNLKAAKKIYYRIGAAADTKWTNFRMSFTDANYQTAPSFELIVEEVTPVTEPTDTPTPNTPTSTSSTVTISASVGKNGVNKKADVKIVQSLLNKVPYGEGGIEIKLVVDGLYGTKTLNAIIGFQQYWGYDNDEEYMILKPGSDTFNELVNQSSRSLGKEPLIKSKAQLEEALNGV